MNFLFWNLNKKTSFFGTIADIISEKRIDILAVAEFDALDANNIKHLLQEIRKPYSDFEYMVPFKPIIKGRNYVSIFFRKSKLAITNKFDAQHISVKEIKSANNRYHINGIFCHLGSKLSCSNDEQADKAATIAKEISMFEESEGCSRTFVCGDFNMSPFEDGLIMARAFHAVMDKRTALKVERSIEQEKYKMFYNPMWSFYGDSGKGEVNGSYYFSKSVQREYFWHIFDQVIIRPSLINEFDESKLDIISSVCGKSLLTDDRIIDKDNYSDHLPIVFTFNI